ncbi:NAD(P)/FAD-dependent oxidoreductase [Namhaeicola litoreus]|uniref:NAD(P)/FAD-dependent oxidoreductase n=1 Tax=Namhaeicola litoreus TaxID=1052145 RepID=A0ABW3Y127_9FLAO
MKIDYLIVGLGIAGLTVAEHLKRKNKNFLVVENESQTSSWVAGGVYNPVILKRFTPVWNAMEQLDYALPFYESLESFFKQKYIYPLEILRIFKSIEEQNNWFSSADHPAMAPYLTTKILPNNSPYISAPLGFGKMNHTGRVNIELLLADYKRELEKRGLIIQATFDYSRIDFDQGEVKYDQICAKRIIFCEGFGLMGNPFFNYLPMQGLKGEVITIKAPNLNLQQLVKSGVFIMPLGEDLYKVGATFNWQDKTNEVSDAGKTELVEKVRDFIKIPFEIIDQKAGIRPTVADRRPLLGKHPMHPELVVFNGLGTRGVMISPLLSKQLIDHLESDLPLPKEADILRFRKRFNP